MVLLIIEALLMAYAWKRGWKSWVQLPIGVSFITGLAVGTMIREGPGGYDDMVVVLFFFNLMATSVMAFLEPPGSYTESRERPVGDKINPQE